MTLSHLPLRTPMRMRRSITIRPAALLLSAAAVLSGTPAGAQSYDPGRDSPLSLLAVPADGVAYFDTRTRAEALFAERKYAEAEPLAERLVREYPRDGENWILLGRVKGALDRHAEAAAAFERAGPLMGWGVFHLAGVNAAINRLAAGDREAAFGHLRREVFERRSLFRTRLYDWVPGLRSDPEFLKLVGRADTAGWTRDQGWTRDVEHLHAEVKRTNPDYHDEPLPAEFTRRYEELKRSVPRLSDEEIYVGMARMLASLHQGHVALFTPPSGRQLPLHLYAFPEGIFVVGASEPYADLVGSRLLTVGSVPAEEALRRLAELRSTDGDMQHVWGVADLASVPRLRGLGIIGRTDSASVVVQRPGGPVRRATLATVAPTRQDMLVPPKGVAPPLFLSRLDQRHWERALPEHDALYVQMNNVTDDPDETLAAFGRRLRGVLAEARPGNLIVDLRHNNGGSTSNYPEFLRTVIGFSQLPGSRVYVLIGRRTFSATANLITDLERLADPVFVGEASSECCHFYGDPAQVVLPYSGIMAELTAVKWNLSRNVFDERREMSPEVPVQLTATDYFAGRDPALDAVFRLIRRRVAP